MKILIIGAGLSGLALAQGLAKAGIQATVFERDESPLSRTQGYRISIRPLGMAALKELLPSDRMRNLSSAKVRDVGDAFICANEQMAPLFTVPLGQDAAVQFLRSELRAVLLEGINVEWNKRLTAFEDRGDQIVAHFEDGSQATGDLLVGYDGAGSLVRALLPSVYKQSSSYIPKIVELNRTVLGGQIERTPEWDALLPLNQSGMVRYVGPDGQSLGVCFSETAKRQPTVFWGLSSNLEFRQASQEQILNYCKKYMDEGSWHDHLKKLIFDTPTEAILPPWHLRTTQFPDTEQFPMAFTGRATLLGDAAHAMPPDRGLGGNSALEDARLLTSLLSLAKGAIDWPIFTASFEKEMFTRAKAAVRESEDGAKAFQSLRTQK